MISPEPDQEKDWRERPVKFDPFHYQIVAGVLLIIVAALVRFALFPNDVGYRGNLYTTALGVLITIVVLDRRAERREAKRQERDLKERLIRELGSKINEVAVRAAEELRAHGWLADGSLKGQELNNSILRGANLKFANLESCSLAFTDLTGSILFAANLQSAFMNCAILQSAKLHDANFKGADLTFAFLQGALLERTNLQETKLDGAQLQRAHLINVNAKSAFWAGVNLEGTICHNVDLQWTCLAYANLKATDLTGSKLAGADLSEANLGRALFSDNIFSEHTTLPDGSKWTPDTDMRRFTDPTHPHYWRSDDPKSPAYRGEERRVGARHACPYSNRLMTSYRRITIQWG